jgi:hypothetical protein
MEDAVTGFVLYTGFDKIQFVSRSSCITKTGGACVRSNNNTIRRKNAVVNRIQASISSQNMNTMKNINTRRPVKPKLDTVLGVFNASPTIPININSSKIFFEQVERFLPHFTEQELAKVERILSAIESRTKSNNKNTINRYLRVLRRSIASVKAPPPLKNINQQRANGQRMNNNQQRANGQRMNNNQRRANGQRMNNNQQRANGQRMNNNQQRANGQRMNNNQRRANGQRMNNNQRRANGQRRG